MIDPQTEILTDKASAIEVALFSLLVITILSFITVNLFQQVKSPETSVSTQQAG